MAVYTYLQQSDDPATGLACTVSPGGGGSAATLSFLLVAWDDPDEKDINLARFAINITSGNSGKSWADAGAHVASISKSVELNDLVTITWTPPRRRPHHYALYYQAAASYSLANPGIKILPSTLYQGEIPGYARTLTLPARAAAATYYTARTWTWVVPCAIDTTNHYIDIRGNWMGYFKTGTSVVYEGQTITNRQVDAKALYYDRGGEYTRLTVAAGPTVGTTYVSINVPSSGLFCPVSYSAAQTSVIFSPTRDMEHQSREMTAMDITGNTVQRSYMNNSPDTMIELYIDYTAVVVSPSAATPRLDGGALYQLAKWRRWGRELDLIISESDSSIPHGCDRWRVTIEDINDYQIPGVKDKDEIKLILRPNAFYPAYYDYGGWLVTDVTAGAATCVITGPYDRRLVAGAKVWIMNSTGNDGLYVISSVSIGTNSHTLTFTTALADSTDNGYLVLEDMA